jgi:hypothetical protein
MNEENTFGRTSPLSQRHRCINALRGGHHVRNR